MTAPPTCKLSTSEANWPNRKAECYLATALRGTAFATSQRLATGSFTGNDEQPHGVGRHSFDHEALPGRQFDYHLSALAEP